MWFAQVYYCCCGLFHRLWFWWAGSNELMPKRSAVKFCLYLGGSGTGTWVCGTDHTPKCLSVTTEALTQTSRESETFIERNELLLYTSSRHCISWYGVFTEWPITHCSISSTLSQCPYMGVITCCSGVYQLPAGSSPQGFACGISSWQGQAETSFSVLPWRSAGASHSL